jgi:HEAT repeat protein
LQQALQQYQKTDDLDARKSLLNDVVSTADDDTSKQEAVQVLGKMFQGENSVDLKLEILEDLVLISHPSTIVPLVDAIDPSQPTEVRVTAAQALGSLGDKRAIPFLEQALSDPDPEVQQAARDALDTLRPE